MQQGAQQQQIMETVTSVITTVITTPTAYFVESYRSSKSTSSKSSMKDAQHLLSQLGPQQSVKWGGSSFRGQVKCSSWSSKKMFEVFTQHRLEEETDWRNKPSRTVTRTRDIFRPGRCQGLVIETASLVEVNQAIK